VILAATTLILQQPWLLQHERDLMLALQQAAERGCYWDELSRMQSRDPDTEIIIQNIVAKCRTGGLVPALEHLKAYYDHRHPV
jgi:hypothetical protein